MPPCCKTHIQRITAPYRPQPEPETHAQIMQEKKVRAAHNKKICRLWKVHLRIYENKYGKFIPDSENAVWCARRAPRIAALMISRVAAYEAYHHDHPDMVEYFTQLRAFEAEFGHPFVAVDDREYHFKRMESHTWTAALSGSTLAGDIPEVFSFDVSNPYPQGDQRRVDFDRKLRIFKRSLEGSVAVEALPAEVADTFTFHVRNPTDMYNPQRYYDVVFVKEELQEMSLHHWEALHDCVGESTDSPFVKRPPLW
ncbi:hypothetical protein B0H11DRAFT_1921750 [Mycena galericulata]|nr:hypothetical protein B0H11DRAFT_1921750 [Mycena galericulata]